MPSIETDEDFGPQSGADVLAFADQVDTDAEELMRKRARALGLLVNQLALSQNGLADPEINRQELAERVRRLVGELGLTHTLVVRVNGGESRVLNEDTEGLLGAIRKHVADEGLSLRAVAERTPYSHSTISAMLAGNSTTAVILKVAEALGLHQGS